MDLHYKIGVDSDHGAKFRGDWPTELGDVWRIKKNEIWRRAQLEAARRPKSD